MVFAWCDGRKNNHRFGSTRGGWFVSFFFENVFFTTYFARIHFHKSFLAAVFIYKGKTKFTRITLVLYRVHIIYTKNDYSSALLYLKIARQILRLTIRLST